MEYQQDGLHPENPGKYVIARASGDDFDVASVRSYRGAVDSKVSDIVDEAFMCHVDA